MSECPICNSNAEISTKRDALIIECDKCGRYSLADFYDVPNLTDDQKIILKHYFSMLEPFDQKRLITIKKSNIDEIINSINYPKNLIEKVDFVLEYFAKHTNYFGQVIKINDKDKLTRLLFCKDDTEFKAIINYLTSKNYLTFPVRTLGSPEEYSVTMEGLSCYQEFAIKNKNSKSNQGFVAMWFNNKDNLTSFRPNMQEVYQKAIAPAIEHEAKYISVKIDCMEYCNDINDEMISQIRKSRFLVADLTGYRGGVYWEAGFAEGLGIPVIYTCHEQWLKNDKEHNITGVHFDINHRNIILWTYEDLEKFKIDLINRIGAVVF